MEVEIRKGTLVLLLVGLALAILLALGAMLSPRVGGHPLLLSPANWKLTRYLGRAEEWLSMLEAEEARLAQMIPLEPEGERGELPLLATPPAVESVYQRSQTLNRSLSRLEQVRRQMEEAEEPSALRALQALALASGDECLKLHGAVSTASSSPSKGSRARAREQAQTTADHLLALRRALEAQLLLLGHVISPGANCPSPPDGPLSTRTPRVESSRLQRRVWLPLIAVEKQ